MPTYNGKPIDALFDNELKEVFLSVKLAKDNYDKAINSEEYKKKMKNRPIPEINPNFTELFDALQEELNKRKLVI